MTTADLIELGEHPHDAPRVLARMQADRDALAASDETPTGEGRPIGQRDEE